MQHIYDHDWEAQGNITSLHRVTLPLHPWSTSTYMLLTCWLESDLQECYLKGKTCFSNGNHCCTQRANNSNVLTKVSSSLVFFCRHGHNDSRLTVAAHNAALQNRKKQTPGTRRESQNTHNNAHRKMELINIVIHSKS